jgi:signal transduction histidine kinase
VSTLAQAVAQLAEATFDVISVDLELPDSQGVATFDAIFTAAPHIPVVAMTNDSNEEVASATLRRGAQDFLVKGDHPGPLIARSLWHAIERHRLEEQLRQSQKNEAIGSLADGIAHEFNNLLQVIVGYTRYALEGMPPTGSRYRDLEQVLTAADRAVHLTRQLLGLSRPRPAFLRDADVGLVISELVHLLRPLLGDQLRLETALDPAVHHAVLDRAMLQQALMNLCINARDAMPDGGLLRITTRRVSAAETSLELDKSTDECLVIEVSDTGCGIPEELLTRVLEPFFTTKESGKGTGLGLPMVASIVRHHRGELKIDSTVGQGTTVRLYLPLILAPSGASDEAQTNAIVFLGLADAAELCVRT